MKFIRVLATLLLALLPAQSGARFPHGYVASIAGLATVNLAGVNSLAFINLAKGLSLASSQTNFYSSLTSNGFPNGTLGASITGQVSTPPSYYNRYLLWFVATSGNFQTSGPNTIVYSGGAAVTGCGGSSCSGGGNFTMGLTATPTSSTPVEFAFGAMVTSVTTSTGSDACGAGLVKFAMVTSSLSGYSTGSNFIFQNGISGLPTGPNADGSWPITKLDAQTMCLNASSAAAGLVSVTGTGGPGVQTEGLAATGNVTYNFLTNNSFSNFTNLVWIKKGNLTAFNAGQLSEPLYVSSLAALNPKFIRLMDFEQTQGNNSTSYTYRPQVANFTWGATNFVPSYYAGAITNGGASGGFSDLYTAANPAASPASGACQDGEIVMGQIGASAANVGYTPALTLTGRTCTAPILNGNAYLQSVTMTGTVPPTGTVISWGFNGGGIASANNPFTYTYTTSTTVAGPGGVLDTSFTNIWDNIVFDINNNTRGHAGPLVTAGLTGGNSGVSGAQGSFFYNPNINSSGVAALNNGLTITGSDSASSATYNFGTVNIGFLANSTYPVFTYSSILGGWVTGTGSTTTGGLHGGPPIEFYLDLATRANVGIWFNVPLFYSANNIYSTVKQLGQGGVKELAVEVSNEDWNSSEVEFFRITNLGNSLGITQIGGLAGFSMHGLRTVEMAQQAVQAWSDAGRSRSQLRIISAYQFVNPGSTTQSAQFNGSQLNASGTGTNVTLKAYGGLGATALTTDFSSAPNRPVDWSDDIAPAPYYLGGQYNSGNGNSSISTSGKLLSYYNCSLVAAYNYVNGNSAAQSAALDFLNTNPVSSTSTYQDMFDGTLNGSTNNAFQIANWEVGSGTSAAGYYGVGTIAAGYDTSRSSTGTSGGAQLKLGVAAYEGGWAMGPNNSGDASTIAGNLTTLGFTAGYTSSLGASCGMTPVAGGPTGASDTAALNGTNLLTLLQGNGTLGGWKNDARSLALATKYFTDFQAAVNVVSTRDAFPAWYGFDGPNVFALAPGPVPYVTPYQPYNALAAFH